MTSQLQLKLGDDDYSCLNESRVKTELGQFFTSPHVANFMASMFPSSKQAECHLLDAGAGVGALSHAFLDRWAEGRDLNSQSIEITAYEIDEELCDVLRQRFVGYSKTVVFNIIQGDYIKLATVDGLKDRGYTHAILNPPYKKINSRSAHRLCLRTVGVETVNLYTAFIALAVGEMTAGGHLVAIIPRSFCNGPYYRSFRKLLLKHTAIRRIHLFESRDTAFRKDKVLQENVIIHLEKDGEQGPVTVSTSTDDRFYDLKKISHPFERIVFPDDSECFIHIPTSKELSLLERAKTIRHSLRDIGVSVSTGPVVSFRSKKHLRSMPEPGSVPLIQPAHLKDLKTSWPIAALKKPNAIMRNEETDKRLYPIGFYCLVRRFSSKEEKKRLVASLIAPENFSAYSALGFENHLNVLHDNKQGLSRELAYGLFAYLNATAVDDFFRRFSGHTQVNATDLKQMKYPSRDTLIELGAWAISQDALTQDCIDAKVEDFVL